ncbi:tripartite tricarboxylate transporter substrate-binding protein [Achromobacter sp. Marseille-Q4962]|uniref:Bug family tripartite tricarboxylate transporter substrate binding protein n=1 Tax=Achromobacter sp. Marseille-Q4962 TaxID=2942202 RepID=UPI002074993D|nr:tripartite tricarboxylate transporter substrate-binding protein [Achromobacter sp. Marseille-Q4962]
MNRREFLAATLPAALAVAAGPFPARPAGLSSTLRIQVGAPPGGGTDLVARALAQGMAAELKRNLVVENKPGAGGNIAAGSVSQAVGDPNTLLVAYTSFAINPSIQTDLPYDPLASFTPLSLTATSPLMLVCRPDLPVKNTAELMAYVRQRPKQFSIGGAGLGSASQMAGEMLKARARLDVVSVPYKGAAPAVQDLLGGQIQLLMSDMATVQPLLRGGRLKALGVSTPEPLAAYPGVEPIARVLPGFDYRTWFGLFAPRDVAAAQADRLSEAAQACTRMPEIAQRLEHHGLDAVGSGRAEFEVFIRAEIKRWRVVAEATGMRLG